MKYEKEKLSRLSAEEVGRPETSCEAGGLHGHRRLSVVSDVSTRLPRNNSQLPVMGPLGYQGIVSCQ